MTETNSPRSSTAIDGFRVALNNTRDVSGLVSLVEDGRLRPDDVVAVTGKTEGWGDGYDASRVDADQTVRRFLLDHGTRRAEQIDRIPMAFSAGVGTILTPHLVVYARSASEPAPDGQPRLAVGSALSEAIRPEWVGTGKAVEANADAVRAAAGDAGIQPEAVEFVVGKAYYPTRSDMDEARAAGRPVLTLDDETMFRLCSGSAALGVGVAVEGMPLPRNEDIGRNPDLWSDRLAVSANPRENVAGARSQLIAFGNRPGAGGRLRVGHSAFNDLLDVAAVARALRRAGMEVGDGPLSPDHSARILGVYMKFSAPVGGRLRGRRQVTEDPTYDGNLRTVVASAFAGMLQDTMIWVSSSAVQQGPAGGGTLGIVVDVG